MATSLREHLLQQSKVKETTKKQEKDEDVFKFQFPFEEGDEKPFLISP